MSNNAYVYICVCLYTQYPEKVMVGGKELPITW